MSAADVLNSATSIIGVAVEQVGTITTALPYMLVPIGFVFARKIIGLFKSLTFQKSGRRR